MKRLFSRRAEDILFNHVAFSGLGREGLNGRELRRLIADDDIDERILIHNSRARRGQTHPLSWLRTLSHFMPQIFQCK